MPSFDDRLSVEEDSRNDDMIDFLGQVYVGSMRAEPSLKEEALVLDRVRRRLLAARPEEVEALATTVPALRLVEPADALPIPLRSKLSLPTARKRSWVRRMALIAATLSVLLVVGSILAVLTLARYGSSVAQGGSSGVYVLQHSGLQKLRARDGAVLWKYPLAISETVPTAYRILASPTQDIVYVIASQTLLALKASDGHLLWSKSLDGRAGTEPVLDHNRLYLLIWQDTVKFDNHTVLEAFDALSGKQLWHYAHDSLFSSFAVANGSVYGAIDLNSPPDTNNKTHANFTLFALNAGDGSAQWSTHVENPSVVSMSALTAADGKLFLDANALQSTHKQSVSQSALYAYNAANGAFLWHSPDLDMPLLVSSPLVVQQRVYVFQSALLALDEQSGKILWRYTDGVPEDIMATTSHQLIDLNRAEDGTTHETMLNAIDGSFVSQATLAHLSATSISSPVPPSRITGPLGLEGLLSEQITYLLTTSGTCVAFDNQTGAKLWSVSIGKGSGSVLLALSV